MLKVAFTLVVWLAGASVALACTRAYIPDFEIDHSIEDSEAPAAAVLKRVRITRGKGPTRGPGSLVIFDSCNDLGGISIEIDTDDPEVGYFLVKADGHLPHGLTLPEAARPARGLSLSWIDGRFRPAGRLRLYHENHIGGSGGEPRRASRDLCRG